MADRDADLSGEQAEPKAQERKAWSTPTLTVASVEDVTAGALASTPLDGNGVNYVS